MRRFKTSLITGLPFRQPILEFLDIRHHRRDALMVEFQRLGHIIEDAELIHDQPVGLLLGAGAVHPADGLEQRVIAQRLVQVHGLRDGRIYDYAETDQRQLNRMWDKRQRGYRAMGYEIKPMKTVTSGNGTNLKQGDGPWRMSRTSRRSFVDRHPWSIFQKERGVAQPKLAMRNIKDILRLRPLGGGRGAGRDGAGGAAVSAPGTAAGVGSDPLEWTRAERQLSKPH